MKTATLKLKNKSSMEASVEYITPEIAEKYLRKNSENRQMGKDTVAILTASMERGEWRENGETIKFSEDGVLLDGQHRLQAIIKSQKSYNIIVVRNLDKNVMTTLDIGKRRTFSDILTIKGYHNCTTLASALNILWAYKRYGLTKIYDRLDRTSNQQLINFIEEFPNLHDSILFIKRMKNQIIIGGGIASGLHQIFSQLSPGDANVFFNRLYGGYGMNENDPILALRDMLFLNKKASLKFDRHHIVIFTIMAWNAFRENKEVKSYQWNKLTEEVPEII